MILSMKQYLVLKTIKDMGGKDIYFTQIVARLGDRATWAHAVRILNEFDKMGIISTAKRGRVRIIELTEKGERVLKLAEELLELMKPVDVVREQHTSTDGDQNGNDKISEPAQANS